MYKSIFSPLKKKDFLTFYEEYAVKSHYCNFVLLVFVFKLFLKSVFKF